MALEIDGLAVLCAIAEAPEAFPAIRSDVTKAAHALVTKQLKAKTLDLAGLRAVREALGPQPLALIVDGLKDAEVKALVTRLGRKETVLEPCYKMEQLIELALDADEYKVLTLVDGKRSLFDVCTQGPHSAAENAKVLYAFQILQLIRAAAPATAAAPPPETPRREEGTGAIKIRFKTQGDKFSA